MALNSLGLGFIFSAKDAASGTMRKLSGNFNSLQRNAQKGGGSAQGALVGLGASAAVAGVGIAGLAIGIKAAGAFGEFEQGVANVGATMNATQEEMKQLSARAIQAGIDTQFSPVEATQGLDSLAAAGQSAQQSMSSLTGVLDLAAGSKGQLGLQASAEAVVGTLNSYGLAADQAANITDKLLLVTQKSNFQARDFSTGLAKAAASGAQFDQSIETVLVTMGFLRNANIDASSSATAVREATTRLAADSKAQQAVTGKGVKIFDKQTGKMRQLTDIMFDLSKVTKDLGTDERSAIAVRAFGKRGLLAFNAVSKGTFTTMRDGKSVTLKGAEAIKAFTESLQNASGVAAETRRRLLDTFEGQKTLLKGTLQTLAIVGGEAFSNIFRPIVSSVTSFLNAVIKVIKATPKPIKTLLGGLFLAVSAFATMAGGTGILVAGFVLLLPVLKIVAISIGALSLLMLPVIAAFALGTLAVVGFREAFDKNVGGIADSASGIFDKISLGAKALFQFFSEGKISGAVAKDLIKAENVGVFNFVNNVVRLVERVINFFKGISKGFSAAVEEMGPTFERLGASFEKLGKALGFLGKNDGADAASARFQKFGEIGESVGDGLAFVFDLIVQGITSVIDFASDLVEAFKKADVDSKGLKKSLGSMEQSLRLIGDAFDIAGRGADESGGRVSVLSFAIQAAGFVFNIFAGMVASVFGTIADVISSAVVVISSAFDVLSGGIDILRSGFSFFTGDVEKSWSLMKRGIFKIIRSIVSKIEFLMQKIVRVKNALGFKDSKDGSLSISSAINSVAGNIGAGGESIDDQIAFKTREINGDFGKQKNVFGFGESRELKSGLAPALPGGGQALPAAQGSSGFGGISSAISSGISALRVQAGKVDVKVLLDSDELAAAISKQSDDSPGGPGTGA